MGNVLFLHAIGLSEYALEDALPRPDRPEESAPAFRQLSEKLFQLPEVKRVVALTDLPAEVLQKHWRSEWGPIISRQEWSVEELLRQIRKESEGYEHIFYTWADAPLLDIKLSHKMFENHRRFFADYTFADGYPRGLSPEIIKPEALAQLIDLSSRHEVKVGRGFLFEIIQKDINAFDLETEVAPIDQRLLRVMLTADTRRNFMQLHRIISAGGKESRSVQKVLAEQPGLLRTLPAFFNVQITGGCPQSCSYCPYPQFGGEILKRRDEMALSRWEELLKQIKDFADDAVISISAWGEPALHSQIDEVIAKALEFPDFSLVIETSGVGWSLSKLEAVAEMLKQAEKKERITWIVSLDANEREMYRELRGDQWEEALATIDLLRGYFPGQVYVQAVRMKGNEDQLDQFYQYWNKQEDVHVIVQKYDSFCGVLPERKVTDLSPIERFPCWHLKRDVQVLLDGKAPMCREDLREEYLLGNVFEDGLEKIWQKGHAYYLAHIEGEYPKLCRTCDEYYTYNF